MLLRWERLKAFVLNDVFLDGHAVLSKTQSIPCSPHLRGTLSHDQAITLFVSLTLTSVDHLTFTFAHLQLA